MTDGHPDASAQSAVGVLPAHLQERGDPDKTKRDYMDAVHRAITEHPRSLQRAIGPSEIGDPCARRIGHKLLGTPERTLPPNWKATVGTAIHAWLEDVFDHSNQVELGLREGQERWLVETKVTAAATPELEALTGQVGLAGSCDLYDRVTATVIDHKTTSPARLKDYRRKGDPGATYRIQAHTYGLGWVLRGFPVDHVAISFLSRNGDLSDSWWWSEPWDGTIAAEALQRLRGIATTVSTLGAQALAVLPTADAHCTFCPFYERQAADLTKACPGHEGSDAVRERPTIHQTNPADPFS